MKNKIISLLLGFTIKDWLIVITLFILVLCILEIRKLKKSIAREVQWRLFPQLVLELILDKDSEKMGFFLQNKGFFLVREIKVEDLELILDDFGYSQNFILKFENIDFLRPKERVKLRFKVYNSQQDFLPRITESIIPHLVNLSFKVRIRYSNIESFKFCLVFFKKGEKFYTEGIESYQ